jgi:hypothetical protein
VRAASCSFARAHLSHSWQWFSCGCSRNSPHFVQPAVVVSFVSLPLALSGATAIQFTAFDPVSLRFISVFSHQCLGPESGLFPSGFPTVCISLPYRACHMPHPSHPPNNIRYYSLSPSAPITLRRQTHSGTPYSLCTARLCEYVMCLLLAG